MEELRLVATFRDKCGCSQRLECVQGEDVTRGGKMSKSLTNDGVRANRNSRAQQGD